MKIKAAKNMRELKEVLDELGIIFWLDGGTLLGAWRDKDFCEDDEADVDFGGWANYQYLIPEVISRMKDRGFDLFFHWQGDSRAPGKAQEISFIKDGLKTEIFFYEKRLDKAWAGTYDNTTHLIPQVVPAHFFEELKRYKFKGVYFNIPRNTSQYLTHRYGDWRTPIHASKFSCYNPDQLRAIDLEYPFYE